VTATPFVRILSIASVLLFAASISAQELPDLSQEPSPQVPPQGKRVKVGRTVYDFDEVDILGRLKRPEGKEIMERPELRFRRLLDLDESFLPNIVRAVDEF